VSVVCGLPTAPLHLSRVLYKSTLFMQNKPNFQKSQMNVNSIITIDYENIIDWTLGQNKPNSNPIKACPERSRMGQSLVKDLIALVRAWMFIRKTAKNSCSRCRSLLQCFSENFDKPGELKTKGKFRSRLRIPHLLSIGSSLIGAGDPMNLLGTMPAKEGKIDLKHSFYGSAFCFEFYKTGPRP